MDSTKALDRKMMLGRLLAAYEASLVGQPATKELAREIREMNRFVGALAEQGEAPRLIGSDTTGPTGAWEIDRSTASPILVYEECSVIQDEQALYLMNLLQKEHNSGAPTDQLLSDPSRRVSTSRCAGGEAEKAPALSTFLDALEEWGCEDNDERARAILQFLAGGCDLSEYAMPALSQPIGSDTLDSAEIEAGVSSDGSAWRFWSKKAIEMCEKKEAADAREKQLRAALERLEEYVSLRCYDVRIDDGMEKSPQLSALLDGTRRALASKEGGNA